MTEYIGFSETEGKVIQGIHDDAATIGQLEKAVELVAAQRNRLYAAYVDLARTFNELHRGMDEASAARIARKVADDLIDTNGV